MANAHIEGLDVPGTVEALDLRLADGEAVAIIGPDRAGNTRLLRAIAGLDSCRGSITVGGDAVHSLAAGRRPVAMVFRDLALYPHLDVEANIAFPLRHRPSPAAAAPADRDDRRERIDELATQLDLRPLLESRPHELAPRQRIRVALARAVAWRPRLLLFDDALSTLPSVERLELRASIRRLQRSWRLTTIYAASDAADAMSLGDRIAVIAAGRLAQVDTPSILYANPATTAVARALGAPPINLLDARLDGQSVHIGEQRVAIATAPRQAPPSGVIAVGIRPETFETSSSDEHSIVAVLEPDSRETLGGQSIVRGRVGDQPVVVIVAGDPTALPRRAYAPASRLLLFDRQSGVRLR